MRVAFNLITRHSVGNTSTQEYFFSGDSIRIGRGTNCDIHFPDQEIALLHAVLEIEDGWPVISTSADAAITVNDQWTTRARLNVGDCIGIGHYQLTVEPSPGEQGQADDLVLTCEVMARHKSASDDIPARATEPFALNGRAMRRWSWALALIVAVAGIGWPLLGHFSAPGDPVVVSIENAVPLTQHSKRHPLWQGTSFWLSGAVSRGHRLFQHQCSACHRNAFVQVGPGDCLSCHSALREHVRIDKFPDTTLASMSCMTCHQEHDGDNQLVLEDSKLCLDCHMNPDAMVGHKTHLAKINDFGNHPEFRSKAASSPTENGLLFPHELHLSSEGVADLNDKVHLLECADCHRPQNEGANMSFPAYQADCSGCHGLQFSFLAPERSLPHGDVGAVKQYVHDTYAVLALQGHAPVTNAAEGKENTKMSSTAVPSNPALMAWVREQSAQVIDGPLGKEQCAFCHRLVEDKGDPLAWDIEPVKLKIGEFAQARFNHASHQHTDCLACHQASRSEDAADLLLPGVATCQVCHSDQLEQGKIASDCVTCHGFHTGAATQMKVRTGP